ncbi:unnamed protein product [Chondrus crispus]|uniref:Uncharacterized protein n=1 Tax=Chondrus crispus TaxID=2769 RepID=R7QK86_CHOCR|nr:unnamed protein product [Chondrus crispus]CDF37891.1 unnamed protein product [Chondrus crispus]|eukprot:XP_005717762.1 unnamed protein product [Chondrus crispus]
MRPEPYTDRASQRNVRRERGTADKAQRYTMFHKVSLLQLFDFRVEDSEVQHKSFLRGSYGLFDFLDILRSKIEKPVERCMACISICDPTMLPGVGYGSLQNSIRRDFESFNLSTPCAVNSG